MYLLFESINYIFRRIFNGNVFKEKVFHSQTVPWNYSLLLPHYPKVNLRSQVCNQSRKFSVDVTTPTKDIFSPQFLFGSQIYKKNSYQEFGPNYVVKTNYSYLPEHLLVILVPSFPVVHFFKPLQNCKLSWTFTLHNSSCQHKQNS